MKNGGAYCFLFVFLLACQEDNKPDISAIEVEIKIERFDKALFSYDSVTLTRTALDSLNFLFGEFPHLVYTEVLGIGNPLTDTIAHQKLRAYLNNKYVREVYDTVQKTFDDLHTIENKLRDCFKYRKYYFPNRPVPRVITFISNFTFQTLTLGDEYLGIGLDLYLGGDYKYYEGIFPKYLTYALSPGYLPSRTMQGLIRMEKETPKRDNTLLSSLLEEGIELYYLDMVLPDEPDHFKMNYTEEQLNWCIENEGEIWNHLISNKLIFSTEKMDKTHLIDPAPATSGMPPESPGRVGVWVGWQIIRKYMKENENATFDILFMRKPEEILKASKYKPKA